MHIRYEKLQKLLAEKKLDAVLVSDGYNMRYLSGFTGATGYLLITKNTKTVFTDSRYTIAATAQAPDYTVVEVDAGRDQHGLQIHGFRMHKERLTQMLPQWRSTPLSKAFPETQTQKPALKEQ